MKKYLVLALVAALVSGCAETVSLAPLEGRQPIAPIPGGNLTPAQSKTAELGAPTLTENWHFEAAAATNRMPHAAGADIFNRLWARSVGKGTGGSAGMTVASPVVHAEIAYALDAAFCLTATDMKTGGRLWKKQLPVTPKLAVKSIGLAFHRDTLIAVAGDGGVFALSLSGEILWQRDLATPLRAAPIADEGRLFLLSATNRLIALDAAGKDLWSYQGEQTQTNLLGLPQPAAANGIVVAPFTTGDVIAFNAKDGAILWHEALLPPKQFSPLLNMAHIPASPVIAGDTVHLVGATQMGAYQLKTGKTLYSLPLSFQTMPIISGNALFLITHRNTLVALERKTGKLFWETPLRSHTDEIARWHRPLLIAQKLLLTSSQGDRVWINAQTGAVLKQLKKERPAVPPIAVQNGILVLSDKAQLVFYR